MINCTTNQLSIIIPDASPLERKQAIVKALMAALRWKTHVQEESEADRDHQVTLVDLLEAIVDND